MVNRASAVTMRGMAMDLKRMVGRRVKQARKDAGLTQEALAERIERAVETVSNLERGHTLPTLDTLERVSRALGVPIRDFFEIEADASPRRAELRLRMDTLLSELSDADFDVAVGLVRVLAAAKAVPGVRRAAAPLSEPSDDTEDDPPPKRRPGSFPHWE